MALKVFMVQGREKGLDMELYTVGSDYGPSMCMASLGDLGRCGPMWALQGLFLKKAVLEFHGKGGREGYPGRGPARARAGWGVCGSYRSKPETDGGRDR